MEQRAHEEYSIFRNLRNTTEFFFRFSFFIFIAENWSTKLSGNCSSGSRLLTLSKAKWQERKGRLNEHDGTK